MSHLQIIAALEELVERQAQIIRALSARLAQLGAASSGDAMTLWMMAQGAGAEYLARYTD